MDRQDGASRPVFSLWPAQVSPEAPDPAMPAWILRSERPGREGLRRPGVAEGLAGASCVLGAGTAVAIATAAPIATTAVAGAAALMSGLACLVVRADRRRSVHDADWRDTLFERSGISLWREDWSAVGRAILALKQAGVHDMEAYFATRPDEARALRRQVIIKDVNAFTLEMMGARSRADFIGPLDRILPDSDQTFGQWLVAFGRGDEFYRSETHIVRPDGSHLDCLFTAALPETLEGFRDILVTCLDITDYKALQNKLVSAETEAARASRISTMGALTASIAHEVNTPLASIIANSEASLRWLRREVPDLVEAQQAIERAIEDATRTHEVVVRTRAFLSAAPHEVQEIDLAETARVALVLIDRELRLHRAGAHLDADVDAPRVVGDPIQLQQVLVNLMINGLQAMSDQPQARDLTVTIRRRGDEAVVRVADTGVGISGVEPGALFEPFRSTRSSGMGMGLAICRSVIEGLGGRIWAEDNTGAGATFAFSLPAVR